MAPALFLIIVFCVLPVLTGCWEQNLGPLQRGIVLNLFLASELSPQLPRFPFSEGCCLYAPQIATGMVLISHSWPHSVLCALFWDLPPVPVIAASRSPWSSVTRFCLQLVPTLPS